MSHGVDSTHELGCPECHQAALDTLARYEGLAHGALVACEKADQLFMFPGPVEALVSVARNQACALFLSPRPVTL